ncbi:MAG: hypothetical protein IPN09_11525 [Bacteroidetes bacterium]|nr:hypothetical protein [Bacteroidota bacterium]
MGKGKPLLETSDYAGLQAKSLTFAEGLLVLKINHLMVWLLEVVFLQKIG